MKGKIQNISISNRKCSLYLPDNYEISNKNYPVLYINGDEIEEEFMNDIEPHFNKDCTEFIALGIQSEDWNSDFTPWVSEALSKKSGPFKGCALDYLNLLTHKIKPFIDANYRTLKVPANTAMIGYSLGGLTSLYGLYVSKSFGKIGSLSGSLWYDDWINFMNCNEPLNKNSKVYLSLGKSEEKSRNKRMAKVSNCTQKSYEILQTQLEFKENVTFDWNEGGHFTNIPERFKKAVLWLMKC